MSLVNGVKILKKRGRKPKNKIIEIIDTNEEPIDSEKEVIIAYLHLNLNDVEEKNTSNDIFIKTENKIQNTVKIENSDSSEDILKSKMNMLSLTCDSENRNSNGIYINKINIYHININEETKCWWCKNSFNSPNVTLPEQYFNGTFYCIGNFCSYNCTKAYNIDINDCNIWKRESLINLMYYMTYSRFKEIDPSPSWLILKEFGGFMTINDFRKNFETNNSEFILLYPPLISRQMQIEESYKKTNTSGPLNKLDKIFNQDNNYSLKRTKPVETSQLNLEKTMGLKIKSK
jgi:hypothetical protein